MMRGRRRCLYTFFLFLLLFLSAFRLYLLSPCVSSSSLLSRLTCRGSRKTGRRKSFYARDISKNSRRKGIPSRSPFFPVSFASDDSRLPASRENPRPALDRLEQAPGVERPENARPCLFICLVYLSPEPVSVQKSTGG